MATTSTESIDAPSNDIMKKKKAVSTRSGASSKKTLTTAKKAHPFLNQLPPEVSKSMEQLHLNSPKTEKFDKLSNSSVFATYESSVDSGSNIRNNDAADVNNNTKTRTKHRINGLTIKEIKNSSKKELNVDSARELFFTREFELPNFPVDYSFDKELSRPLIQDSYKFPSMEFQDSQVFIPSTPIGADFDIEGDISASPSSSIMATNNDSHTVESTPEQPVINDDTQLKNSNKNHNKSASSVNLLSMGMSIEMYGENAKKSKDPNVLFSYAQILIKSALSKHTDNSITEDKRDQYLEEALKILKKSSKMGSIDSQYYLGDAYSCGLFNQGKPDLQKSLSHFELAGKSRHAESAYRTAIAYRKGLGCTRDARKVIKFLEIASLNNHPVAMMEYGIYCFHGLMGMPEDTNTKKKGISWLRRATECATPLSCGAPYELALIYMNGFRDIVIKDVTYSMKLLVKAVNLGHGKSAALLGKIYEIGDFIDANADLSIHFYNISATLNDADGMMGLCSWYFVGTDHLPKDYDEAFAWALKAAKLGHHRAMLLLQRFYELGLGCDKDLKMSQHWANEAVRSQKAQRKR